MSTDSDYDAVALVETGANGAETVLDAAHIVLAPPAEPAEESAAPVAPVEVAKPKRNRPAWAVPVAIAAVGLIASGALGYLFYSTNGKLEATRHQLAVTQLNLDGTSKQLAAANADAATKKVTADYMKLYTQDAGKARTDYGQVVACDSYATCRFAAQQDLTDLKQFQVDRQAATVPPELSASDSALGDSLSAGIAALQELISGMDGDSSAKVKDGFNKLDDAMLSMGKAEASLGNELQ
jgi:hypothetical protein